MTKTAVVYSIPDCPRCTNAKNVLSALGYAVVEQDGEALAQGKIPDSEAMAELVMTGEYPVVVVDDRAIREGDDLYNLIKEHKEW